MPKASIHYPSDIVDRNGNMGWHKNGKRAYRNSINTIHRCLPLYREARLYHLCFEGMTDEVPHKTNMAMLHALVQMAEREGIKCEWFAAREKADATKADHLHVFMLIDAYGIKVAKLFNQFEDGRVQQHCMAHGVKFAIFSPKDYKGIHGRNTYMALPYQGPGNRQTALGTERLADALIWLSYIGKARSKPTDDADGQIFPASRPGRKRNSLPSTAPTAAEEINYNEGTNEDRTTKTAEAILPLGFQPDQQGAGSAEARDSSGKAVVDARQSALGSEEGASQQEASTGDERYGAGRATAYYERPGMMLTASQNFLASLYEQAVDQGLDIEEVRKYMLSKGVKRTPLQLEDELENTFGFYGYAALHPPKPIMSTKEWDRQRVTGNALFSRAC